MVSIVQPCIFGMFPTMGTALGKGSHILTGVKLNESKHT
jgi:hypothetical protein